MLILTSKLVVQMGDDQVRELPGNQRVQQGHAIGPTRNGHDQRPATDFKTA